MQESGTINETKTYYYIYDNEDIILEYLTKDDGRQKRNFRGRLKKTDQSGGGLRLALPGGVLDALGVVVHEGGLGYGIEERHPEDGYDLAYGDGRDDHDQSEMHLEEPDELPAQGA